jgi:hypothetical protein
MPDATRKVPWGILVTLLVTAAGCGRHSLLPPPGTAQGWDYSEWPETYDPQTLFHYIDGKARAYHEYGFVKLDHAQFATPQGKAVIDVDVYDMGSPEGAFGIYSLERGEGIPLHYKRRVGYMIGSARFFWKGRHYVAITSPDRSPETIEVINTLSLYVENSVPGGTGGVPLLAAFPDEDKVPESEQYFAIGFLGYAFMGDGFTASYLEKGGRLKIFVSPKQSPDAAREAYQKLREALSKDGKIMGDEGGVGETAFLAQDEYMGQWLVSLTGRYVAGATGFHDLAGARGLVAQLCGKLSSLAPSAI